MNMPFTTREFIQVFVDYNHAIFPAQILFYVLGLAALALVFSKRSWSDRAVLSILAVMWIWMGAVYQIGFFTAINKAAYLFGAAYLVHGLLLVHAAARRSVSFEWSVGVYGFGGLNRNLSNLSFKWVQIYSIDITPALICTFRHDMKRSSALSFALRKEKTCADYC